MSGDGLERLRRWTWMFVGMVVVITALVPFLAGSGSVMPGLLIVVHAGAIVVTTDIGTTRPLDISSERALGEAFSARVAMRLALALLPTVAGLLVVLKDGEWWLYFVALAFTAFELFRAWAGPWSLAREQQALDARGCTFSLETAVRNQVPKAAD
jgi:hypothetical protein